MVYLVYTILISITTIRHPQKNPSSLSWHPKRLIPPAPMTADPPPAPWLLPLDSRISGHATHDASLASPSCCASRLLHAAADTHEASFLRPDYTPCCGWTFCLCFCELISPTFNTYFLSNCKRYGKKSWLSPAECGGFLGVGRSRVRGRGGMLSLSQGPADPFHPAPPSEGFRGRPLPSARWVEGWGLCCCHHRAVCAEGAPRPAGSGFPVGY